MMIKYDFVINDKVREKIYEVICKNKYDSFITIYAHVAILLLRCLEIFSMLVHWRELYCKLDNGKKIIFIFRFH